MSADKGRMRTSVVELTRAREIQIEVGYFSVAYSKASLPGGRGPLESTAPPE